MCRCPLAWSTLGQISDQVPFSIGQVRTVEGHVLAPVRYRVAVAVRAFIGCWRHPVCCLKPDDSLRSQSAPNRRYVDTRAATVIQLIGNFFSLTCACSATISCNAAIFSGFNTDGLPPRLTGG